MSTTRASLTIALLVGAAIAACKAQAAPPQSRDQTRAELIAFWTQDTLKPYVVRVATEMCRVELITMKKFVPNGLCRGEAAESVTPPHGDNHH